MNPEEFRQAGHQLIDWVADFHAGLHRRPVMAQVKPGQIRDALPKMPPQEPESFDKIWQDVEELIVPGISHFQHPRFLAFFPSNVALSSVLGDYLSTGLGALGISWESAPALTEMEEVMTDWIRQMVGLSDAWEGVIHDSASTGTLVALICARERTINYALVRGGLQAESKPLTVYVSKYSHSSIDKGALLAGFGRENVRLVAVDRHFALDPADLVRAIEEDLAEGKQPCAVVATTGTTTSTALDPIAAIAKIAQQYDLWLHVDSALAGSAMILPECRWMWDGIEQADSVVLNAHKWLGVPFDCTLYYVRDSEHLVRVMGTNPSYLQSTADNQVKNYRDWGIPLGRRFRALKLWTLIHEQGISGLQARLRRDIANAQWLKTQVCARPNWEVLAPVPLQTVCLRHTPSHINPELEGEELDRHTLAWCNQVNQSGEAYLTPAILDGRWMVRVSIGAYSTELADVKAVWELIYTTAESRRTEPDMAPN